MHGSTTRTICSLTSTNPIIRSSMRTRSSRLIFSLGNHAGLLSSKLRLCISKLNGTSVAFKFVSAASSHDCTDDKRRYSPLLLVLDHIKWVQTCAMEWDANAGSTVRASSITLLALASDFRIVFGTFELDNNSTAWSVFCSTRHGTLSSSRVILTPKIRHLGTHHHTV